jgi:transposase
MAQGQPLKKGVVVEKLKRRAFTAEFKIEAVKLVTENGLSYAEVGRRLDILPKLIKSWEDMYRGGKLIAGAPRLRVTAEQMELSKLRKEVQDLKMERDILKKAAAYFARTSK